MQVTHSQGRLIGNLSYVLLSDKELLPLNQRYLGHDTYTDVLTFDLGGPSGPLVGEVLISYDRVKANARHFGASAQHELRRVMLHGLLHLCGHQDKTAAQRAAMRQLEDDYLNWWEE
jgi:probable rRNA maturation factor